MYDSGASLSMRAKQSARRRSKTYILLLLTILGLRRLPTLANHCAQRASFALLQGKWIELRELTYIGQIAYLIGMRQGSESITDHRSPITDHRVDQVETRG